MYVVHYSFPHLPVIGLFLSLVTLPLSLFFLFLSFSLFSDIHLVCSISNTQNIDYG